MLHSLFCVLSDEVRMVRATALRESSGPKTG